MCKKLVAGGVLTLLQDTSRLAVKQQAHAARGALVDGYPVELGRNRCRTVTAYFVLWHLLLPFQSVL